MIDCLIYFGLSPRPVTVTTRIIIFLVGDPYKLSFAFATGRGDNPRYFIFSYSTGMYVFEYYEVHGGEVSSVKKFFRFVSTERIDIPFENSFLLRLVQSFLTLQ